MEFKFTFRSGYGDIIWSLSKAFINSPSTIIYDNPDILHEKFKDSDAETVSQRFFYIYDNMEGNGVQVKFQKEKIKPYDTHYPKESMPVWRFKKRWVGDGDYITVQNVETKLLKRKGKYAYEEWRYIPDLLPYLHQYNVKLIDYRTPIEEAHNLLLHAKFHVGYSGSTSHLSGLTETPTYIVCNDLKKGKLLHPKANIININMLKEHVRRTP